MLNDDDALRQIRNSQFRSVRTSESRPFFTAYLAGWKAGASGLGETAMLAHYVHEEVERWIEGWNDARCEP